MQRQDPSTVPAAPFDSAYARIRCASLPVRTRTLAESGVENLRILSESKLIELLQAIVSETLADVRSAEVPPAPFAEVVPGPFDTTEELEKAYQGKWNELRGKHEESLRRIEGRMEKLARVFRGLEGAFSRLDGPSAGETPDGAPPVSSEEKRKQLLREMLLRGDG